MTERALWRNRRALVTGASGFIGYWVVRELQQRGVHVTCVVHSRVGAERLARDGVGDTIVVRDLSDARAPSELAKLHPQLVFNLAGYGVVASQSDAETADRINAWLPAALLDVFKDVSDDWAGVRLMHVGSAQEYGAAGGVFEEGVTGQPTTLYGRTKLAGTTAVLTRAAGMGLPVRVARPFTVYGPGEPAGRLLPTLLASAAGEGKIALSAGVQLRDFAYVEDVAKGLVDLAGVPASAPEVVNLATGVLHSVRWFVEQAAGSLGIATDRLDFGAVPSRPDEMEHDGVSVARLVQRIGRALPDDVNAGVAQTAARLRRVGHP